MSKRYKKVISENVKSLLFAVIAALFIRSFVIEPFKIPSPSMKPTLLIGDFIFVLKYPYGYSRHSLPFAPKLFEGRVFESSPERGDVIVFKFPKNDNVYFIKRVIGLPGDRIQMRDGLLYVNDQKVPREYIGKYSDEEYADVQVFKETIGEKSFETLDLDPDGPLDNTREFSVPPEHYFFVGDNRDASNDSRRDVGFVPSENLVGKAKIVFFSISGSFWHIWEWPKSIRFKRLLSIID
ncbi:MAG: signal peptidase I [Alphaproteobacteria bacterium]|nr:signal peptidase I [Alphaproteobacteria bacterium]OJV13578.1 MAG: signal peptidase I [Alphaproteobacteria bacterium 33-17]